MLSVQRTEDPQGLDRDWVEAFIEVERAFRAYDEYLRSHDDDDPSIGRLWLRLWLAERRRDELIKARH
jgi:hypothetical protein